MQIYYRKLAVHRAQRDAMLRIQDWGFVVVAGGVWG